MRRLVAILVPFILVSPASPAAEPSEAFAFRGARILPVAGEPIDDGVLVVRDGKIVAVGPEGHADPGGAHVVRDLPAGKTHHPRPGRHAFAHRHLPAAGSAGPRRRQRDDAARCSRGLRALDAI